MDDISMEEGFTEISGQNDEALLPIYLKKDVEQASHPCCGTISYNRRRKCFVVKGEPYMTEMCKRLFPASCGDRRGEASFPANRRTAEDLSWFMLRFPLEVRMSDIPIWDEQVKKARQAAVRKAKNSALPKNIVPPSGSFNTTLKDFQKEGLWFILTQDRCLLADDMGLGKTVQALAMAACEQKYPVVIVAPPHLVTNWIQETMRFLRVKDSITGEYREPVIHKITGITPYTLPEADIYIIHYLLLRGWKTVFAESSFPTVIFDEIQELRHSGTEKYSSASLLSANADHVVGLSGTPIYNRGGEIWNVINILDFHFLGDFESFSREWCSGYGRDVVVNPALLGDYLKQEGLMLRRTKAQVLKELPPKRRLVQELDWNDAVYAKMMEGVIPEIIRWKTDTTLTPSQRALLEDNVSQRVRQATGAAKAPYVCQFVKMLLESGETVLLFAHHHAVMDIYRRELKQYSPGFITGLEDEKAKTAAVDRFMTGKTNLLCVSLRSGSGLNLQRATCVVFGELDWSPAVHTQAEDRAHRMGQQDSVLCYYLVAKGGSDASMQEALGLKVSQFTGLMGDEATQQEEKKESARYAREYMVKMVEQLSASLTDK